MSSKALHYPFALRLALVLLAFAGACRAEAAFQDTFEPGTGTSLLALDEHAPERDEAPRAEKVAKQRIRESVTALPAWLADDSSPAPSTWLVLADVRVVDSVPASSSAARSPPVRIDDSPRLQLKLQLGQAP